MNTDVLREHFINLGAATGLESLSGVTLCALLLRGGRVIVGSSQYQRAGDAELSRTLARADALMQIAGPEVRA